MDQQTGEGAPQFEDDERKLFVGNISYDISTEELKSAFEKYGNITSARLVTERGNNKPRGFGFITFESEHSVEEAIKEMQGYTMNGRELRVDRCTPKTDSAPPSRQQDNSGFRGRPRDRGRSRERSRDPPMRGSSRERRIDRFDGRNPPVSRSGSRDRRDRLYPPARGPSRDRGFPADRRSPNRIEMLRGRGDSRDRGRSDIGRMDIGRDVGARGPPRRSRSRERWEGNVPFRPRLDEGRVGMASRDMGRGGYDDFRGDRDRPRSPYDRRGLDRYGYDDRGHPDHGRPRSPPRGGFGHHDRNGRMEFDRRDAGRGYPPDRDSLDSRDRARGPIDSRYAGDQVRAPARDYERDRPGIPRDVPQRPPARGNSRDRGRGGNYDRTGQSRANSNAGTGGAPPKNKICFAFQKGECKFGDSCKYKHELLNKGAGEDSGVETNDTPV